MGDVEDGRKAVGEKKKEKMKEWRGLRWCISIVYESGVRGMEQVEEGGRNGTWDA